MAIKFKKNFLNKKLIVFDLDGTLTESKASLDEEMARRLRELLRKKLVAVIGGGKYEQFRIQFLKKLKASPRLLKNLFLFPDDSTLFYGYKKSGFKKVYGDELSGREKKKIFFAFEKTFKTIKYKQPARIFGRVIEDRGTEITFSALGQKAPLPLKKRWNREKDIRPSLMKVLKKELPEFTVESGGLTSVDVTKKGIDKAYGIRQIKKHLGVPIKDMLFVGDALYPGGNDSTVKSTKINYIQVSGPKETKRILQAFI